MTRRLALLCGAVGLALIATVLAASAARSEAQAPVRFRPVAIYLDSASEIAAYQVEVKITDGNATFVGVEGGDGPFAEPPYYDTEALSERRIRLAAFDPSDALDPGRHRVATLHVRELGADASYSVSVTAVADREARRVDANAALELLPEAR